MAWADWLNEHPLLAIFILLILQLPILYSISNTARFYIRMTLYYLTIFIASNFAALTSIPTYFQNRGGTNAFATFNFFSSWVDIELEIRNRERLEEEGSAVLLSNHQSSVDIVIMGKCWPDRCTCMMKNSLKYIPGFNMASMLSNTIFVDRFNPERAQEALEKAVKTMLDKNLKIWVFPEGTRFRGKGMLPFKKGAFNIAVQAQIPIVPIVVSYYGCFYSKEERMFKNRGQVIVQVLEPIPTKDMKLADVPALVEKTRNLMLEEFEKISVEAENRQKLVDSGEDEKTR